MLLYKNIDYRPHLYLHSHVYTCIYLHQYEYTHIDTLASAHICIIAPKYVHG